jgi:tetratricopeptide (TPR) repeat protein
MRYQQAFTWALVFLVAVGMTGCGVRDDGTIPITTSSDTARQEYLQGRALLEKLRAQEAIPHFERAVKADPSFALAHLALAQAHQTPREFFASYHRAVSLLDNAGRGEQLMILATQAGVNGDARKQLEYLEKLVELYPRDVRAVTMLASYYFGQQDHERAIEQYTIAAEIDPEYSPVYNQLGYSYRYLGQYDKAEEAFKKYTSLIPDDPNPYDSYAELLLKSGQFEKSIAMYRKALEINPGFVFSHVGIATNLMLQGDHAAAREQLRTMYAESTNEGRRRQALSALATTFIDEGLFDSAIVYVEKQKAMAEESRDFSALSGDMLMLTVISIETGRYDEAEKQLQLAWEYIQKADVSDQVKENSALNGYYFGARIAAARGDFEKAKSLLQAYAEWARRVQNPAQQRIVHELAGIVALAEGRYGEAVAELKQANQHSAYNQYRLGLAYEALGEMIAARSAYHRAAHFNEPLGPTWAFVRQKALDKEAALSTL